MATMIQQRFKEQFSYVGKIRRGEEQRTLKISQFVRSLEPDCDTCIENGSKNYSGTNPKQGNKIVLVYAAKESVSSPVSCVSS